MPRSIRPLIAGTAMTLLLVASPLLAQTVYTWKDAKGVTHYSDAPPPKGKYSDRRIEAPPPTPATPVADTTVPAAEAASRKPSAPMADDAVCAQARLNLARLQGDAPVGPDADGDGKPDSTLSAEDRVKQREIAQAAITAKCPAA